MKTKKEIEEKLEEFQNTNTYNDSGFEALIHIKIELLKWVLGKKL
jgi:hypothetical protein